MNMGRMQRLGVGRGKRRSQGKREDERVNHDTAPSTKGITRLKVGKPSPSTEPNTNKMIKSTMRMLDCCPGPE
jgi:hypothetical protein